MRVAHVLTQKGGVEQVLQNGVPRLKVYLLKWRIVSLFQAIALKQPLRIKYLHFSLQHGWMQGKVDHFLHHML
jgi:hypothetical protein